MRISWRPSSQTIIYALGAAGVLALGILAGCAPTPKEKPAAPVVAPAAVKLPSVEQLTDGRQGFVIHEKAQMDTETRRAFDRAVERLNAQDYGQAIDLLEKVIAQTPDVTAPHIDIAIAYAHVDKLAQAEAHLKTALELIPDHPVACNAYGLLHRRSGRFAEARAVYEKALLRFPDYYPLHRNLGILCDLYLNDPACALAHYEAYSTAQPDDKQVKLWIADLHNRMKGK